MRGVTESGSRGYLCANFLAPFTAPLNGWNELRKVYIFFKCAAQMRHICCWRKEKRELTPYDIFT